MPITYRIDRSTGIIRTKCAGVVTLEDVLGHLRALESDPECPPRLDVLLDFSEWTSEANGAELRAAGDAVGSVSHRVQFGACAIVAPTDLLFGMARMFEVFAEAWFRAIQVFRAAAAAEAWLSSQESSRAVGSGNEDA
ncbi:MAG: STAS/SEC14 domain-containing protein [Acidobacteriota bacterium]